MPSSVIFEESRHWQTGSGWNDVTASFRNGITKINSTIHFLLHSHWYDRAVQVVHSWRNLEGNLQKFRKIPQVFPKCFQSFPQRFPNISWRDLYPTSSNRALVAHVLVATRWFTSQTCSIQCDRDGTSTSTIMMKGRVDHIRGHGSIVRMRFVETWAPVLMHQIYTNAIKGEESQWGIGCCLSSVARP